jgi:FkbH-like protein
MNSRSLKCGLLSSFTLDALPGLVNKCLEPAGIDGQWYVSPFNQYPQLILAEDSELVAFAPQIVFMAVAFEDLFQGLSPVWSQPRQRQGEAAGRINEFIALVRRLCERLSSSAIFVNSFLPVQPRALPILASKSVAGERRLALEANHALANLSDDCANLHVVHLEDALAGLSGVTVPDARYFYLAKMRLGRSAIGALAEAYSRRVCAYLGLRKKCIVLDLDNTLWGGILGEDGLENLRLSDDGPGKAFQDMQRLLLDYHETGTLLAICSKNDEPIAMAAIRDHPRMLLRLNHFAAMRINWDDKASNLVALAKELNLGLDSLVFLDDSPFECAEVRRLAPQVTVLQMPADPSDYPAFVAQLPYFDALSITEDDRRRGQMYVEDRQRKESGHKAGSLEDFLKSLDICVSIRRADRMLAPRLAQLSQRTNQFNLTTRRYTESDLFALLENQNWRLYGVLASDRIGDSGISGAAFVQVDAATATARLDTFLVSCRVLGRGIESAFLAGVCSDLQAGGIATLVADYVPSDKNGMARDFLPNHGFQFAEPVWRRPLDNGQGVCPAWIQLKLN